MAGSTRLGGDTASPAQKRKPTKEAAQEMAIQG
jgi:hypothetical protein